MKYVKYAIRVILATAFLPFYCMAVFILGFFGLIIMSAMWAWNNDGHNIYGHELWQTFIDFFDVYKLP